MRRNNGRRNPRIEGREESSQSNEGTSKIVLKVLTGFVSLLVIPLIIYMVQGYLDEQKNLPKLVGISTFEYGTFKSGEEKDNVYNPENTKEEERYSNAVENRIWLENSDDKSVRITNGVLKIDAISPLEEEDAKLQMIVGTTEESKVAVYMVNNSYSDVSSRYFSFVPYSYWETFPILDDSEMEEVFNAKKFEVYVDTLHSGDIVKLFEFDLSEHAEEVFARNDTPDLFTIECYTDKNRQSNNDMEQSFNPFALYYEDGELNYEYLSQGDGEIKIEGENTVPAIYVDVSNTDKKEYYINIDNVINGKQTECLMQYIIPNQSCKISYSIELEVNGKRIINPEFDSRQIEINVPIYIIEEGIRVRNEEAFLSLTNNNIEKISSQTKNKFTQDFLYDSKEWMKNH